MELQFASSYFSPFFNETLQFKYDFKAIFQDVAYVLLFIDYNV